MGIGVILAGVALSMAVSLRTVDPETGAVLFPWGIGIALVAAALLGERLSRTRHVLGVAFPLGLVGTVAGVGTGLAGAGTAAAVDIGLGVLLAAGAFVALERRVEVIRPGAPLHSLTLAWITASAGMLVPLWLAVSPLPDHRLDGGMLAFQLLAAVSATAPAPLVWWAWRWQAAVGLGNAVGRSPRQWWLLAWTLLAVAMLGGIAFGPFWTLAAAPVVFLMPSIVGVMLTPLGASLVAATWTVLYIDLYHRGAGGIALLTPPGARTLTMWQSALILMLYGVGVAVLNQSRIESGQQSLARSRERGRRMSLLLDGLPVPTALRGGDGRLLAASRSFQDDIARDRGDLLERAAVAGAAADGREQVVRNIDGETEVWDVLTLPLSTADDQGRTATMFVDVTDRVQRIQQLEGFAGVVAHDLKNPMTAMSGWLEVIKEELDDDGSPELSHPGAAERWARMNGAATRAARLIEDLLIFSGLRSGPTVIETIDLVALLREVLTEAAAGAAQHARPCRLRWHLDAPSEGQVLVQGDRDLLRCAVAHLVDNVVVHRVEPDEAHLEVQVDQRHGEITMRFADRGPGIPDEDLARVVQPFERAVVDDTVGSGAGLGLAIVDQVMARAAGRLEIGRRPGGGTCVTLHLPEQPSDGRDQEPAPDAARPVTEGRPARAAASEVVHEHEARGSNRRSLATVGWVLVLAVACLVTPLAWDDTSAQYVALPVTAALVAYGWSASRSPLQVVGACVAVLPAMVLVGTPLPRATSIVTAAAVAVVQARVLAARRRRRTGPAPDGMPITLQALLRTTWFLFVAGVVSGSAAVPVAMSWGSTAVVSVGAGLGFLVTHTGATVIGGVAAYVVVESGAWALCADGERRDRFFFLLLVPAALLTSWVVQQPGGQRELCGALLIISVLGGSLLSPRLAVVLGLVQVVCSAIWWVLNDFLLWPQASALGARALGTQTEALVFVVMPAVLATIRRERDQHDREARELLERTSDEIADLLRGLPLPTACVTRDDRLSVVSAAMSALGRRAGVELETGSAYAALSSRLRTMEGEPVPRGIDPMARARNGERTTVSLLRFVAGDEDLPLLWHCVPLSESADGGPEDVVIIAEDVTEELARRQQLEAFAGRVSQVLVVPVAQVESEVSGWLRTAQDPGLRMALGQIASACARGSGLVSDLLHFSTASAGRIEVQRVDLDDMAARAVEEIRQVWSGLDPERRIDIEVAPLGAVTADPLMLRQTLVNLIGNAVKYVPPERDPVIRLHAERGIGRVALHLDDNGIGIPVEMRTAVLRPFQRAHREDTRFTGTGLGLAICAVAAQRHGGALTMSDGPGSVGTRATLTLPEGEGSPREGAGSHVAREPATS